MPVPIDVHDDDEDQDRPPALRGATYYKEAMDVAEHRMNAEMYEAWAQGASYEEIGRAVGMTKQAAHYRVNKQAANLSYDEFAFAENVPIGATIASQRRGHRPTVVADKRVGLKAVTFYDENDRDIASVPLGAGMTFAPAPDGEKGADA